MRKHETIWVELQFLADVTQSEANLHIQKGKHFLLSVTGKASNSPDIIY